MTSGPTDRLTTLWEPPRPVASFLVQLPVIVLSPILLGMFVTFFIDNTRIKLGAMCSVAAVGIVTRVLTWWTRDARRVLVSSETAIGVRVGSKIVFEAPWADAASIKLNRGDSLAQIVLDPLNSSAYPHLILTPHDRWAIESSSPELAAFLPKDYQLLAGALADECRRRSVPFSCD